MESKGKVVSILSDSLVITLEGVNRHELESLEKDTDYRIKLVKWREKRSQDANSYAWVLMSKIAEEIQSSKDEVYEQMLQSYGVIDPDFPPITVVATADMSRIDGHWLLYKSTEQGGKMWNSYLRIIGSSEYDTKQMSTFIDGIIYEAKNLGIETLPSEEVERMKSLWKSCGAQ